MSGERPPSRLAGATGNNTPIPKKNFIPWPNANDQPTPEVKPEFGKTLLGRLKKMAVGLTPGGRGSDQGRSSPELSNWQARSRASTVTAENMPDEPSMFGRFKNSVKSIIRPTPRLPSGPRRGACSEQPSKEEMAQEAELMRRRFDTFNPEEQEEIRSQIATYLAKNDYIPTNPEIAADIWYQRAIQTPSCFINMLLTNAKLENLVTADGDRMFEDSDIDRIRNMLTAELVQLSVKRRKATWLINMASSPCFRGFAEANYLSLKKNKENIKAAEDLFKIIDKTNTEYVRDVTNQIRDAKMTLIRTVWSLMPILLEGVDVANYDGGHFVWPIPAGEGLNSASKLKYILDNNLIPTSVGETNLRNKSQECIDFIKGLAEANSNMRRRSSDPSQLSLNRSASNNSSDGMSGGRYTAKKARRKQRKTRRRQ